MARYGKSVKLMLADTFPEMHFNEEGSSLYLINICISISFKNCNCLALSIRKRNDREHRYWDVKENRRQFLLDFAKKNGFDPLIKENWKGMATKIQTNESQVHTKYVNQLQSFPF